MLARLLPCSGLAALAIVGGCTGFKVTNVFVPDDDHAPPPPPAIQLDAGGARLDASQARCPIDGETVDASTLTSLGINAPPQLAPSATKQVTTVANLDARSPIPSSAWDATNPSPTSNYPSSLLVFDSLGNGHQIEIYFVKSGPETWDWHVVADGRELEGGSDGIRFESASGTLTFNADGALQTETTHSSSWNFEGATAGQDIAFDFGDSIDENGTGLNGVTNFALAFITNDLSQDGYAGGAFQGAYVSGGNVVGAYTNGQTRVLGPCP